MTDARPRRPSASRRPPEKSSQSGKKVRGGDARLAAIDLVEAVLITKTPLDERLAWSLDRGPMKHLDVRDRAFARAIAATTLRRLGQIDALLEARLQKALPSQAHKIRTLFRCSIAELAFLGTPAHATISTAVALADTFEKGYHYKGLLNAILRRIAEDEGASVAAQDAGKLNTPEWLWDRWSATYGEDIARAIAEAQLDEPPLDISVKGDPAKWAKDLEAEVLPTGTLRKAAGGRIEDLPGFKSGAIWVQDAAAAMPAKLFGNVSERKVFDLCAAPGGKTMQLAAMGAEVTALDKSPKRLARLSKNLKRTELTAQLAQGDAATWTPKAPAPFVLLDAPCSATGTARRHPDVLRLKKPEDIASLTETQTALLEAATKLVEPGGTLVYCVCSLEREEGPDQIEAFLKRHSDFTRAPITAEELGGLAELITPEGDLRTLPCHLADKGGLDGFYAARLIKS